MNNRKRNVQIKFRVTEEERSLIEEKMKQVPTSNMEAYLRKMAINGYIIQVDLKKAFLFFRCHLIQKESIVGHQNRQDFHPAPVNIVFNLQNS